MNQEQTFKRRFARWSIRVLAVLLVALTCTFCFFSFESDKNVAEAEEDAYTATPFNMTGAPFNGMTSITQMASGTYIDCLIMCRGNKKFLANHDSAFDSIRLNDIHRDRTEKAGTSGNPDITSRIWRLCKQSDGTFYLYNICHGQYIGWAWNTYNDGEEWGRKLAIGTSASIKFKITSISTNLYTMYCQNLTNSAWNGYLDGGMYANGDLIAYTIYDKRNGTSATSGTNNTNQHWYIFPLLQANNSNVIGYSGKFKSVMANRATGENLAEGFFQQIPMHPLVQNSS
ncbi:MAG: hypothetical protein E7614_07450 [Ruminococcaceae bacterium]|nr:hypothetical protein [Oscillospiraceae bacterium]